jgi:nitric oxide reductase NorQ protein
MKNENILDQDRKRMEKKKAFIKRKKGNINIQLKKRKKSRISPLYNKYNIQKYDLHPDKLFDEFIDLIPENIADYIDDGNNYIVRIIEALYHFKQCALIGPSGTGKTHAVYLVAELTGLPLWEINCALNTSNYDLIGRYIGLGKENWIDGQVTLWLKHGGLLYLDEVNMMRQDVASRLNPVFDARGHLIITEKDNEIVPRHEYSYCIVSINPLRAEYTGVKRLNIAFKRRMSIWIDFNYPSVAQKISQDEIKLIMYRSKIDEATAHKILTVGAEMRRQYLNGDILYGPSPRDLVNWAILIKNSGDPILSAESTIIPLTSDDSEERDIIRNLVMNVFR